MNKYTVDISRKCVDSYEVEADSVEEAKEKALEAAMNDDWSCKEHSYKPISVICHRDMPY